MKKFKEIREKNFVVDVSEKKHLNYVVDDSNTVNFLKSELGNLVKADFKVSKKGSKYELNVIPRTSQDEKVVKSFMDDAKIEMLKNEFIHGVRKITETKNNFELTTFSGDVVVLDSETASKIVEIHDSLKEENQEVFMEMLVYSKETFDQVESFCNTYSKE